MAEYRDFIPENIAPKNVKRIGVYGDDGKRKGTILLGSLAFPDVGQKLYSFAALSDVHIGYETAVADFQRALTYLNTQENVNFICVCGDLSGDGSNTQLAQYQSIVNGYSPNTPVYAIAGNHEGMVADIENRIANYTGQPLYYSFNYGNDVFIMVGTIGGESYSNGVVFADGTLSWLRQTLEANKDKRCFVFQHIFAGIAYESSSGVYVTDPTCGNAGGIYTNWCWHDTAECLEFEALMKQYKNVTWFHGHSHIRFSRQCVADYANLSREDGYRSVHIPSLAIPRDDANNDGAYENFAAGSEGYIVDVYENGIHLRGWDFVAGNYLPIASYWLDTSWRTGEANAYNNPTGQL